MTASFLLCSGVALLAIAGDHGVPGVDTLACERGLLGETVWHLGQALLPALEPHEGKSMFARQTLLAVITYVALVKLVRRI